MKSKITVVAATAVTITLLFLSYLLLCYQPSANQILCGISNLVAGNDLVYQTYTVSEQASQLLLFDFLAHTADFVGCTLALRRKYCHDVAMGVFFSKRC